MMLLETFNNINAHDRLVMTEGIGLSKEIVGEESVSGLPVDSEDDSYEDEEYPVNESTVTSELISWLIGVAFGRIRSSISPFRSVPPHNDSDLLLYNQLVHREC